MNVNVDYLPCFQCCINLFTFVTLYITVHVTFISQTLTGIVYHLNSNLRAVIFPVLSTGPDEEWLG